MNILKTNWYKKASRTIKEHVRDVVDADMDSPIFITEKYEIIDGAHRTCKAFLTGQTVEAIILSQNDINKALLPDDSKYVGQIYRDDQKDEYSVTKLLELYGNKKTVTMQPEIIIKQSQDVWGKKVDIYEIMAMAKKRMEQSKKARQKAKFPFSLDILWQEISRHFSSINTKTSLPKKIGSINNISIRLVDGDKIKKTKNMDFVEGGHDRAWDFIPKNEIWVDASMDNANILHIIYHEYIERYLMKTYNMAYDDAHDIANDKEKERIK